MLKIGDFSKLSRISIRMLRYYDETGLLKPAETDSFTGYRYYNESQLAEAARITAFHDMGFTLSEISRMLYCNDNQLKEYFTAQRKALQTLLNDTAHRLQLLDTAEKRLEKEDTMSYTVTLKTIPERYAATVRMIIPSYDCEGMLWDMLCSETDAMNLIPDDPCLCCAVFHDADFRESNADVEIQKTVKGTYPDTEHVVFKTEPSVTVASTVVNGAYEGIDAAMQAVAEWVRDNGYKICGSIFNIYHVSPHETNDATQFVTEICYPVKAR